MWEVAVLRRNQRVLAALDALSRTDRYKRSVHVQLNDVMDVAISHVHDTEFLEWLYTNCCGVTDTEQQRRRCITDERLIDLMTRQESLAIVQWLHMRSYTFSSRVMDAAAATGNLALVHFLHHHSTSSFTPKAMDTAAASGYLDIVQFLHGHRTEGCTQAAMSLALEHGHVHVLAFLDAHRTEGYDATAVDKAAWNGHLATLEYAHRHSFRGFSVLTMSFAITHNHLALVQFLHEHRTEGCTLEALLSAATSEHDAVVDFLCNYRPLADVRTAIRETLRRGLVRLTAKLVKSIRAPHTQRYDYAT